MGPCFPRDVNCLKTICLENGVESGYKVTKLLNELNDYTVRRYLQKIKSFNKKKVGILGVAYKPNVPYIFDSQPIQISQQLEKEGYEIHIYDPVAQENAKQVLKGNIHFCSSIKECVERTDVIFIGTVNHSNVKTKKQVINPWK
jgi:UDPglucose 6-dehydrogenase